MRYSLENPHAYVNSNVVGTLHVLEGCRHHGVEHLVYASTSSVYGANTALPFSVHQNVDHPVSLYAATKKANELMAHTYAHLYGLPVSGLALLHRLRAVGTPGHGALPLHDARSSPASRSTSSTTAITRATSPTSTTSSRAWCASPTRSRRRTRRGTADAPDPATSSAPYRLYNIGNNTPVELMDFIACIEKALGKTAKKNFLPLQAGDVPEDLCRHRHARGGRRLSPKTSIEEGVRRFVAWYRAYYKV